MAQEADSNPIPDQLDKPQDAGKGPSGKVKRWIMEIDLADKTERKWRQRATKALERFRDETDRTDSKYNIYWANVETIMPMLYSTPPKLDIRDRFSTEDKVNVVAADILERALEYSIDSYDFDQEITNVLYNYCIPSRGVARVRFEPTIENRDLPTEESEPVEEDEYAAEPTSEQKSIMDDPANQKPQTYETLAYAHCYIEHVPWDRFRRGPGITWREVPWVTYEHQLTREEVDKKFPGFGKLVEYDITMEGVDKSQADSEPTVFKRVKIYEIWDKQNKKIYWLAPSYKEDFLKTEDDKLELEGFFDCERPLYAVSTATTLVPKVEYDMYRDQARELDRVTMRIGKLVNTLKQRGIYNSTIKEFEKLFSADDNQMIPTDTGIIAMEQGGMDKAVWMMPIAEAAAALKILIEYRESVKTTIYEITGIGDIMRGQSDPDETYGAQKLKEQTGGRRVQRKQRDIQRFIRGLLRKKAEIIAQNYTPELLSMMTGINLPSQADKAAAQQQIQVLQAQQQQMPPQASGQQAPSAGAPPAAPQAPEMPPQLLATLNSPTWEEVMHILRNDMLRTFRIDIETDSTIATDLAAEREQVTELITGIGTFVANIGPAVQEGAFSVETAKQIMLACLRKFKLGREVEDIIEKDMNKPPVEKPDPEIMKMQAEMQIKQQETQGKIVAEQEKQKAQAQQDLMSQQADAQRKDRELGLKHTSDIEKMQKDHQLEMEKLAAQHQAKLAEIQAKKESDMDKNSQMAKLAEKPAVTVAIDGKKEIEGMAQEHAKVMAGHSETLEGIKQIIPALAEAAGHMQAKGNEANESMKMVADSINNLANTMGAEREAVVDPASGRIRGSRLKRMN